MKINSISHRGTETQRSEKDSSELSFSAPLCLCGKTIWGSWLPDMDLNHDKQIQSLLCYRYTIGQEGAGRKLNGFENQSSCQTSNKPRRGNIFVVGDSQLNTSSVRSDICRPDGAELFLILLNYKDFAPNGALN